MTSRCRSPRATARELNVIERTSAPISARIDPQGRDCQRRRTLLRDPSLCWSTTGGSALCRRSADRERLRILVVMSLVNATLTLPGIAVFILTIVPCGHSNVRSLARSVSKPCAVYCYRLVDTVYHEAFRAIFDANVTHRDSAGIMAIRLRPVRGFAVVADGSASSPRCSHGCLFSSPANAGGAVDPGVPAPARCISRPAP